MTVLELIRQDIARQKYHGVDPADWTSWWSQALWPVMIALPEVVVSDECLRVEGCKIRFFLSKDTRWMS
jgi:hypothetical protein